MRFLLVLCVASAAGCGLSDDGRSIGALADGDVVELRLQNRPAFVIGAKDLPESQALYLARMPQVRGDRVFVANALREIRVFDVTGRLIRTIGRLGDGPGEFRALTSFTVLTDGRIATFEVGPRRLQLMDSLGNSLLLRTLTVPVEGNTPSTFLPDGGLVALGRAWPQPDSGITSAVVREVVPILSFDSTGAAHRLAEVPGFPWWVTGSSRRSPPLTALPAVSSGPGFVVFTDGVDYRIRMLDLDSRREQILALGEAPPPINPTMAETWLSERQQAHATLGLPLPQFPDGWQRLVPDRLPGYWRLLVSATGCIWARRYRAPGSRHEQWDVIDPWRRQHVAAVAIDADFEVSDVGATLVVGLRTDSLGVQRIMAFEIQDVPAAPRCERE